MIRRRTPACIGGVIEVKCLIAVIKARIFKNIKFKEISVQFMLIQPFIARYIKLHHTDDFIIIHIALRIDNLIVFTDILSTVIFCDIFKIIVCRSSVTSHKSILKH